MPKKTLITAILALVFCFSGHLFMTAYTEYSVNVKKLALLRGQERFVKNKIKEFEQKKIILESVNNFIHTAEQSGLTQNQWDPFFVNLKDEPISFLKLQTVLAQTSNSHHYYFKPDSLIIRRGALKNDDAKEDQIGDAAQISGTVTPSNPETPQALSDVTISLNGVFLVKRRVP
ncbi:MAG: hypothetical protein KKE44_04205 [Proteobacteria bacterium]|nr:hypothetical protein [Pseudomonadota bacterium]MBU1581933.1 hypothetical protein [Pseudomonadota bacterium]MBU2452093.1 hypothetical protein [Pseudomonadota bacterium]